MCDIIMHFASIFQIQNQTNGKLNKQTENGYQHFKHQLAENENPRTIFKF